jgi:hypothetical protein
MDSGTTYTVARWCSSTTTTSHRHHSIGGRTVTPKEWQSSVLTHSSSASLQSPVTGTCYKWYALMGIKPQIYRLAHQCSSIYATDRLAESGPNSGEEMNLVWVGGCLHLLWGTTQACTSVLTGNVDLHGGCQATDQIYWFSSAYGCISQDGLTHFAAKDHIHDSIGLWVKRKFISHAMASLKLMECTRKVREQNKVDDFSVQKSSSRLELVCRLIQVQ